MDQHTFRVLEFDKVLRMAEVFGITEPGRTLIGDIKPLNTLEEIHNRIDLVSECRRINAEGRSIGIEHFGDLSSHFKRVRPEDAVIEPAGLMAFLPLFYSAMNLKELHETPLFPLVGKLVSGLITHRHLAKAIVDVISIEGKILDDASPALLNIRRGIRTLERKIKTILEGMLKKKELSAHLQDFYITERNNRQVIPVKRDSKGSVPGVIHGISNTGETLFIEPYDCQQIGNELESFRSEEKLEEFRILQSLTSLLRDSLPEIEKDYRIVIDIDRLQAIGTFADRMKMSPPEINEKRYLRIVRARHPILWKTLKNRNRENDLVPLFMEIGSDHTAMIITGSNAGGKTVVLKTVGIVTLMSLSGMHVPAESGTTVPFLTGVLTDIGDEQSIEQNLSTYSAHITRISEIIRRSGGRTLVIIDELGTGTDPEQGGALSCAVLRKLIKRGALTIASTHLGLLKAFASSEPGTINSAMEMQEVDVNGVMTYRPTFQLILGEPGTSHAFEIAESLGLDKDVIREAREILTGSSMKMESLLSELRSKSRDLDFRLEENKKIKEEISNLRSQLKDELMRIDMNKKTARAQALKEAAEIIRRTKAEAQDIIKTMRKASLDKSRKIVRDLAVKHAQMKREQHKYGSEEYRELKEVREGQQVYIPALSAYGVIHSVHQNMKKCRVSVGGKEISVSFDDLAEADQGTENRPLKKASYRVSAKDISENDVVSSELNIIGQRVDPALSLVERFLNDGVLSGLQRVKIIHGLGEGILAKAVRDYAGEHPLVTNWTKGSDEEGGEAVTIIYF